MLHSFEFWADSFTEGVWLCDTLSERFYRSETRIAYKHNFIPVYSFGSGTSVFEVTVYGGYGIWRNIPQPVSDQTKVGKPDIIVYHPASSRVLVAIEETAAVPTGNQSLQRLERVLSAAEMTVPFVYLMGEYGLHRDGGARRTSIWPAYFALKLSCQYRIPSLVLFYGSKKYPNDYNVGGGTDQLAELLHLLLKRAISREDDYGNDLRNILRNIYSDMGNFVISQAPVMVVSLPGESLMTDSQFIDFVLERVAFG